MKIAEIIMILAGCYYTFTYGKSLWVDEQNKLGGFGAVLAAAAGAAAPIILLLS